MSEPTTPRKDTDTEELEYNEHNISAFIAKENTVKINNIINTLFLI